MILWVRGRFRNLSSHHYWMIFVTVFVPILTGGVTFVTSFAVDCLVVRVMIYAGLFLVWALFAVIVVAWMVEKDMAEARRLVSQQTGPLAEQVNRLEEEHGGLIADVRLQVEDLESRTRSTFETLGAVLPPRSVSLRARTVSADMTMSAVLGKSGGSKWARLRQWLLRQLGRSVRRVWEVVYGKSEHG